MAFNALALAKILRSLFLTRRYKVAYSGGVDSHVLLHALVGARPSLGMPDIEAFHVNHGLSPLAQHWSSHCETVCRELHVPCRVLHVSARPHQGESPEAAARKARYEALKSVVNGEDCLLTAHHRNDQAETVLLQLLRGAGPVGTSSIRELARFGGGRIARPLLDFNRAALRDYACAQGLQWVEDDSNFDTGFDRNYLRWEVMPRLMRRWPGVARSLGRAAAHSAEAAELLAELARADLAGVVGAQSETLFISALTALSTPRQRNVLRFWLNTLNFPVPSTVQMERVMSDLIGGAWDRTPCVAWPGVELRRYRDQVYAMEPLPTHDPRKCLIWDMKEPLVLPAAGGLLHVRPVTGSGLKRSALTATAVRIAYRCGGERCCPAGRSPAARRPAPGNPAGGGPTGASSVDDRYTHSLKKLFQEWGVPPWLRARIPLLYIGEQLAAVADLWVCEPFAARSGEPGLKLVWVHSRGRAWSALVG
jgi:tRNA(Ile)-lysidine synthetase, N-terminal domain/tRNA(Ile)-lysidine synthetase, C-terminal domain